MKKLLVLFLALSVSVTLFAGGRGASQATEEFPLRGQTVNICSTVHEDVLHRLASMFEAQTGGRVASVRMATGEAVTRLMAERNNPQFDIFFGSPTDAHVALKQAGITTPYQARNRDKIIDGYYDKEFYYYGIMLEVLSIGINTDRWNERFGASGVPMPTSLEELTNPIFRGEIITPNPNTSGTAYLLLASYMNTVGEEAALRWYVNFARNVAQFTRSGFTPAQRVGIGEYTICVNFVNDQLIIRNAGFPMKPHIYDRAGWSPMSISKIRGARNPEAAKAFMELALSREGMEVFVDINAGMATRTDTRNPRGGFVLAELDLDRTFDFTVAAERRQERLRRLGELVEF